ncbi:MAG: MFS transporter [Caulobacteraceae bacterium]
MDGEEFVEDHRLAEPDRNRGIGQAPPTPPAGRRARTILGEPMGLIYLALTEAWERFSLYGMTSLLVLYMVEAVLMPGRSEHVVGLEALRLGLQSVTGPLTAQALSSWIFGWFMALTYFMPLVGGVVADRWLGPRLTVSIGALLLCAGYVAMAFDASFLIALGVIVTGCGFIKGNIAGQVGRLYSESAREARSRGYALFQVAINLGAFVGPLVCGALAQVYGWHVGFAIAAALMLVGFITYRAGLRHIPPEPERRRGRREATLTRDDRRTIRILLVVLVLSVFEQVAYHQTFNVGLIWIRDHVQLQTAFGTIPTSWYVALDGLLYMLATPVLLAFWRWQARGGGGGPSEMTKLALGAVIAAGAAGLFALASLTDHGARVSVAWPIAANIGMTLATVYIWPTLLALFSRKAPAPVNTVMISTVFLALFAANVIVGWMGASYGKMAPATFWAADAGASLIGAVLLFALRGWLTRQLA